MKIGDKVVFTNADKHEFGRDYYPAVGTVGEVVLASDAAIIVQWDSGSTSGEDRWVCLIEDVKLYEEEVK